MTEPVKTAAVLSMKTCNLSDADMFAFIVSLTGLCDSKDLSSAASEDVISLLHQAENEFYSRKSESTADALRKLIQLSGDEIESNFSFGPAVVADARAVLQGGSA